MGLGEGERRKVKGERGKAKGETCLPAGRGERRKGKPACRQAGVKGERGNAP